MLCREAFVERTCREVLSRKEDAFTYNLQIPKMQRGTNTRESRIYNNMRKSCECLLCWAGL